MDSINRNQPEQNVENLTGRAAVEKLAELAKQAETCFFCTAGDSARPMNVREVDEQGNLWFLSASDSRKNQELAANPEVRLFFQGSPHAHFLTLAGRASVSRDQDKIDKLWSFALKTWFTEGKDDPRITVIKFEPAHGYYWDNKHGAAVAGIKILLGAALGKTLDDSIEGTLRA
ncbi:general stress protein [Massilia arenosa]|uniref:General stress protein n=1 Tax=Zemynaea arenosa TaxID=2561931 RepID=A0A4Y9SJD6_9BURK|nr:pyridoxamine 5'-phosphate oxidase family protein [Massilia arenosa]TFW22455.1 general stress protein [Massilia arenosa]